ncbi:hypothetical protein EBR66_03735 [bacterium]|nr:hypothetical protein [bacterium]
MNKKRLDTRAFFEKMGEEACANAPGEQQQLFQKRTQLVTHPPVRPVMVGEHKSVVRSLFPNPPVFPSLA